MIAIENLRVGDELTLPDRAVKITRLVPATTEAAVAYGSREVFSGAWSQTYPVGEKVNAIPGELVRQSAWRPAPGDAVVCDAYDGVWIVDHWLDKGALWLRQSGGTGTELAFLDELRPGEVSA